MERFVVSFSEFINEELNISTVDDVCKFEDRWFFYNPEDDIIYGCDDKPVGDDKLFSFNPKSCTIILNGEEKQYDINNPICLIQYDTEKNEVKIFTEDTQKYLEEKGFTGDINTRRSRNELMDMFEDEEDMRYILINGNELIASTFDVIEES